MDELTLDMSVVQEPRSWGPANHILLNLEITSGIHGTRIWLSYLGDLL